MASRKISHVDSSCLVNPSHGSPAISPMFHCPWKGTFQGRAPPALRNNLDSHGWGIKVFSGGQVDFMVDPPRKACGTMENHGLDPLTSVIFSMIFPVATQDRTDFLPDRLAPLCCAAEGKKNGCWNLDHESSSNKPSRRLRIFGSLPWSSRMLRSSEFQCSGPLHNMRPFWEYVWDVKSRGTGELKVSEDTHTLWKKEHKDTWGTYDWEGRKALSYTWKSILLLVLMKFFMFAGFRPVDKGIQRHPKYWYDMTIWPTKVGRL